jgi:predicted permease
MRSLRAFLLRLANLFQKDRRDHDLAEEIECHLQLHIEDNLSEGMNPEDARRHALQKLGGIESAKEAYRDRRGLPLLETLAQDLHHALRMLRRNPGFTGVVIATLACGIGMNTALFSVINAVLLRQLAYPEADRLVWLTDYDYLYEHRDNYVSRSAYIQWREQAHSFESMTAYGNQDLALLKGDQSSQERIASITGDFWNLVGARTVLGRLFSPTEGQMMVLSHSLFQRRFGGDPRVIGDTVTVNGHAFTITGVLSADFRFVFPQQFANGDEVRDIDAYIPLPDSLMRFPESGVKRWEEMTQAFGPASYHLRVVAKIKRDASMEKARAEMETVYANVARDYPSYKRKHVRLHFAPLKEKLVGEARRALMILLTGVGCVLLIACGNIANLLMARSSTRHREIAIRVALGAGRMRVLRQLLTENVLLALLGGAVGLFLAHWAITAIVRIAPQAVPRLAETRIDAWVLGFTLVLSLATGVLFGLGPAVSIWKAALHDRLKSDSGTSSTSSSRSRTRGLLVATELALVMVLLTGAGLMLKSFWRMNAHSPGFSPDNILVMRVPLSGPRYTAWPQQATYIQQLLERTEAVPGVQGVGIDCGSLNASVKVQGVAREASGAAHFAAIRAVSGGYLRAMGVPLLQGHWPADKDLFGVLVNESFARSIGARRESVGSHVVGSILDDTIVGVVADFKYRQLDAEPGPEIYMPYERFPLVRSVRIVVRTAGNPNSAAPMIRTLVSGIDRTQPVYELQTLEQALADSIAPRRFNLFLLGTLAATALLMALVGIYAVVAYSVAQRTHEIGVRMALGAQRHEIVGMVIRQGIGLALLGVGFGVVAALGLTRLMASLLYEVKPNDPQTFAAVAAILAVTAVFACWIPALRSANVDPLVALRCE